MAEDYQCDGCPSVVRSRISPWRPIRKAFFKAARRMRREGFYASSLYMWLSLRVIKIERDYGEDRYGRLIVDLTADGLDVGGAGVDAGHLRDWPHKNGRALSPKPDWCLN